MIRLWSLLDSRAKAAFIGGLALSVLASVAGILLLGLSGWFLTASGLAGAAGAGLVFNHLYPSAGVRLAAFIRVTARYGEQITGHDAILRLSSALRAKLFERGAHARRGLAPIAAGELSALIDDVDAAEAGFLRVVLPALAIGAGAVAAIGVVCFADPTAGLLAMGAAALIIGYLPLKAARRSHDLAARLAADAEGARSHVSRLVENAVELDVIGALPSSCAESAGRLTSLQNGQAQIEHPFLGLGGLIAFTGAALALACLARADAAGIALATGAALALIAAFEAAGAMTKVLDAAPRAVASARRLEARLDASATPQEPASAAALESVFPIHAQGLVIAPAEDADAISIPDFTLSAGMLLEVIGVSGSGKTTLAETLLRLQPLRAGDLTYAGQGFDRARTPAVLERIAISPQLPDFLPRSLRAQFQLARPAASDADMMAALDFACVGEAVRVRPLGLDTGIDADGGGFSGGELRRIGLARAILCDPEVLILDEPFAGLEAALADRLTAHLADWTAAGARALIVLRHEADTRPWPSIRRQTIALPANAL